ncbi:MULTISPECIES: DNA repair protein RecO [unclassified Treponema]|uniref:DNA repair protein RecO n=1 Tax=unclassified Treponema TaxID=2638727 RepID=UPI0020A5845F|nr:MULTISPECIES: DNA repair protein RecO C-terminal domain-containing protein [unclassified Treponema]UTC66936.1 DNA repair protein RecO C-terminal domain-containing protein [Treponema sp. OMZ 789]UTC69665.1 DNA repair protein RecO C-terminal domain-containing protein [Treponema sp. OMZ 790]UTC72379.1 DNA repair protein RecO C-terminal domain-containing protein [Treponema sp. OMZ 791]
MANRSWSSEALVLSLKTFGEGHRNALLLLPDTEHSCKLIDAAVFGGPKSKLRSMVIPYHTGEVWIYSNPIKNSNKISDFKVSDYRIGLSDNLTRIWCAAFAAELAVKLKGNIDWQIINSFLTGLAVSSENECRKALLRFLWRVISLSGLAPDMEHCCRCGVRTSGAESKTDALTTNAEDFSYSVKNSFFVPHEDSCVCEVCLDKHEPAFPLSGESLLYLFAVQNLIPKISRGLNLSEQAYAELKDFLFYLIRLAAGSNFKTLESCNFLL